MIINKYISDKVSCHDCGFTDFQDYFTLRDYGNHDVSFVCEDCRDNPAPLPESITFREQFTRDFHPTPEDVIGLVFVAIPILMLCVISVLAGGGK